MKLVTFIGVLLFSTFIYGQDEQHIQKLLKGDTLPLADLPFDAVFQKITIHNGNLECTVVNKNIDLQTFVQYKYNGLNWTIQQIGKPGSFYAGNGKVGQILPGGDANIPGIPNIANERDFVINTDSVKWFTCDKTGVFQIFSTVRRKVQLFNLQNLTDKHIINLWKSPDAVFCDVIDPNTREHKNYKIVRNQAIPTGMPLYSISFNDSLVAYIQEGKPVVLVTPFVEKLVSFSFLFTDTTYQKGLNISTIELQQLQISSELVVDGVLTDEAKKQMRKILTSDSCSIPKKRNEYIQQIIGKPEKLISFSFFFTDTTYSSGITLSNIDLQKLQIKDSMVVDGVLTDGAKKYIRQKMHEDSTLMSVEKQNLICSKIATNPELVSFSFFFLDNTYEDGISLSASEINEIDLSENDISDGVLTANGTEKIREKLQNNTEQMSNFRRLEILGKLSENSKRKEFNFYFTDQSYTNGINISVWEREQLGIDSTIIFDGAFTTKGKQKIANVLKNKRVEIDNKRLTEILDAIGVVAETDDLVRFYGFFADSFTYVSTNIPIENVNTNGMISVYGLEDYLKHNTDTSRREGLINILAQRSWAENKPLTLNEMVIIQLGAYSKKHDDFAMHLKSATKISKTDSVFLKSLNIYCIVINGFFHYRTQTTLSKLLRIKKTVYFDNPFVVKHPQPDEKWWMNANCKQE